MANPLIPRPLVHLWSEAIGENPNEHQAGLQRLLKEQRRLTRFIEENSESADRTTAGVAAYFVGVIARMFDLAGGRLRAATWEQVRAAEQRIGEAVPTLLPFDDGFAERVRAVKWRAQPHVIDETLMALFESARGSKEAEVPKEESLKIFFLAWLATEVLDQNWIPPKGFAGEAEYEYFHVEPRAADEESAEEAATEPI
jgi:hypothetical protein